MPNSSRTKSKRLESSIPHWVVYSLFFIFTLLFISVIKAYLPLLMSGIGMLFIWTQLTKEKAVIQTKDYYEDDNQLNLFHQKSKIGKNCPKRNGNTIEPSGQRKRYLNTLDEDERMTA